MSEVTVQRLFNDNATKLRLDWVVGQEYADNTFCHDMVQKPSFALVGHLNFIHPNSIQVLGSTEIAYLRDLGEEAAMCALEPLSNSKQLSLIIIASGEIILPCLRNFCITHHIPLLYSAEQSPYLMDVLRFYLVKMLAVSTTLHGVFLDVLEVGVLLTGNSGMGKSELALELISRGHGLVADDVLEVYRVAPEIIEGRCPAMLRDFLEVRGLGVLNIRTIFGETAVRPKKVLKLIIELVKATSENMQQADRLYMNQVSQDVLGVSLRKVVIPVAAGRNLAVLVEAAVRNHILLLRGINSGNEFIARQQAYINAQPQP
jgi:HPr kinase/phosphorylase